MANAEGNDGGAATKLAVRDVTGYGLLDDFVVQRLKCALDGRKHLVG